jgi:hypothetical protein
MVEKSSENATADRCEMKVDFLSNCEVFWRIILLVVQTIINTNYFFTQR